MRILEYRQNLDAYGIYSGNLHIVSIDIDSPNQNPDTPQTDRLTALAYSDPNLNTDLVDYRFERAKNLVTLVAKTDQGTFPLNLLSIEVKVCSIKLSFHLEETIHLAIPFGNSSGCIVFNSNPIFGIKESYEITWKNGVLSSIRESIGNRTRVYFNVGSRNGNINADFSSFCVHEIEGSHGDAPWDDKNALKGTTFPEEIFPQEIT